MMNPVSEGSVGAVLAQLARIGQLYPTYAGMMRQEVGKTTRWKLWAKAIATKLSDIPETYLEGVVDDICNYDTLPVDDGMTADMLPYVLCRRVRDEKARDDERFIMHQRRVESDLRRKMNVAESNGDATLADHWKQQLAELEGERK